MTFSEDRVNARSLNLVALAAAMAMLGACKEPNHHDNTRPPEPFTERPVQNHRFDGGETDPYFKAGAEGEAGGGGEAAAPAGE
jgi:hypothetical protein